MTSGSSNIQDSAFASIQNCTLLFQSQYVLSSPAFLTAKPTAIASSSRARVRHQARDNKSIKHLDFIPGAVATAAAQLRYWKEKSFLSRKTSITTSGQDCGCGVVSSGCKTHLGSSSMKAQVGGTSTFMGPRILRKQPLLLSEPAASGEGARHSWGARSHCLPIGVLHTSSLVRRGLRRNKRRLNC